ncbi:MAG: hypothetical protein GPJ50_14150, partial [Candidatus Heimdallarchaeota archaeon]|nr:hypothetical protein [Candidatus Heimdallarchaeota archaeon]
PKAEVKEVPKAEVKEVPKAEVKEVPKAAPEAVPKEKLPIKKPAEKKPVAPKVDISSIKGIGAKTAMLLKENGFNTVDKIAKATVEDLSKVPGIGPATAEAMNKEAKNLLAKSKEEAK